MRIMANPNRGRGWNRGEPSPANDHSVSGTNGASNEAKKSDSALSNAPDQSRGDNLLSHAPSNGIERGQSFAAGRGMRGHDRGFVPRGGMVPASVPHHAFGPPPRGFIHHRGTGYVNGLDRGRGGVRGRGRGRWTTNEPRN